MNDFGMYVGILLVSVLISSVSQIILKKVYYSVTFHH